MQIVARNWWTLVLRGVLSIGLGILALLFPLPTLVGLALAFGLFLFADGILNVIAGVRDRARTGGVDWVWVALGAMEMIIGAIAFFMPGITALALVLCVAVWAVLRGVLEIAAGVRLRREIRGEWMLILEGVLAVAFGVLVAFYPLAGAVGVTWLFGIYALIAGVLLISLGFRTKRLKRPGDRRTLYGMDEVA